MINKVEMPPEVAEYYASGRKKAISVAALNDSDILVVYNDGQRRLYHMRELMKKPFFVPLQDPRIFARVYADSMGAIAWDIDQSVDSDENWENRIDLSPDTVYIYGIEILEDNQ